MIGADHYCKRNAEGYGCHLDQKFHLASILAITANCTVEASFSLAPPLVVTNLNVAVQNPYRGKVAKG